MEKSPKFEQMCEWLERDNSCDLYGLNELFLKMEDLGDGSSSVNSEKSLKLKKYKENIYFT